jgi:hypothetical protein
VIEADGPHDSWVWGQHALSGDRCLPRPKYFPICGRRRPSSALAPTPAAKLELAERFDAIFTSTTGFAMLDRQLKRLHALKADLLTVLDRPDVPLHTNGSENDIRTHVTRRKVSGGTRSDAGRDCRDAFLGLMKTCAKQAIRFWDYLGARLGVPGAPIVAGLPALIRSG